jgi:hypothetical protein
LTSGTPGDTNWARVLEPRADGTTRLITRVRSRYRWLSPVIAFSALLEFGDIWTIRKMLLDLRQRAGALAHRASSDLAASSTAEGRR